MSEKTAFGTLTKHVDMKVNHGKLAQYHENLFVALQQWNEKKVSKTLDPERINNMILKSRPSQQ